MLLQKYIYLITKHSVLVLCSLIAFIPVCVYYARDAVDFSNGGLSPTSSESNKISNIFTYPDPSIALVIYDNNHILKPSDYEFQHYYNEILNATVELGWTDVISAYDFPWLNMLYSDDGMKLQLLATVDKEQKQEYLQDSLSITPLTVKVGGRKPYSTLNKQYLMSGLQIAEIYCIPMVFILLCFALGGITAGLLPWSVAIYSIIVSMAIAVGFAQSYTISNVAPDIIAILGLGFAIDYSLFIIFRFHHERIHNPSQDISSTLAIVTKTAGKAILISAMTIMLAVSGGLLFDIPILATMCLSVMIVVMLSCFCAIFLLLPILALLDKRIDNFCCCCITANPFARWIKIVQKRIHKLVGYKSKGRGSKRNTKPTTPTKGTANTVNTVNTSNIYNNNNNNNNNNNSSTINNTDHSNYVGDYYGVLEDETDDNAPTESDRLLGDYHTNKSYGNNNHPPDSNTALPSPNATSKSSSVQQGIWYRFGKMVLHYPVTCCLFAICFLLGFTIYFLINIKFGYSDVDVFPKHVQPRQVFDYQQTHFKYYGHTQVHVYLEVSPEYTVSSREFLEELQSFQNKVISELQDNPGTELTSIYSMISLGSLDYTFEEYVDLYTSSDITSSQKELKESLMIPLKLTDMKSATWVRFNIPAYHYSSTGQSCVVEIRNILQSGDYFNDMLHDSGASGYSALFVDSMDSILETLPYLLLIIYISVYVVLLLMTRSVLLPLKAVILVTLSIGASLGMLYMIFSSTNESLTTSFNFYPTGYVDPTIFIFVFCVAFGLSVDYEVFLMSHMLEAYQITKDVDTSMLIGMQETGSIITTSAMLVAIPTFSLLSSNLVIIKILGVGVAISVIIDATIVRMVLVPVTVKLLGKYIFYCPQWIGVIVDFIGLHDFSNELTSHDSGNESSTSNIVNTSTNSKVAQNKGKSSIYPL